MKNLLCKFGFADVWDNQYSVDSNLFLLQFKQRCLDTSLQEWHAEVACSSKLRTYCKFKNTLCGGRSTGTISRVFVCQ